MGEPDADFDTLLAEQGELMETIEHAEGWDLDSRIEQAMDALRCPPGDEPVTHLSGRRAAPRRAVQAAARSTRTCSCSTNPPTTSTQRAFSG